FCPLFDVGISRHVSAVGYSSRWRAFSLVKRGDSRVYVGWWFTVPAGTSTTVRPQFERSGLITEGGGTSSGSPHGGRLLASEGASVSIITPDPGVAEVF